jgi:hypothetical protein
MEVEFSRPTLAKLIASPSLFIRDLTNTAFILLGSAVAASRAALAGSDKRQILGIDKAASIKS